MLTDARNADSPQAVQLPKGNRNCYHNAREDAL